MTIELRDYQDALVGDARACVASGIKSLLIQLSTGGGKTAIGAHILQRATSKGAHAHFWVHRRELVKQSVLAMDKAGVQCGIIAAGFPARPSAPVQICSIQSLPRRIELIRRPDLILVDECHHAPSATWARLIEYYNNATILGLSATPQRLDRTGLGKWFQRMVQGPSTAKLIQDGWLSPYRIFNPTPIDTSKLHSIAGEFNPKEVSAMMSSSTVVGDAVAHYKRHVMGKRALMFMWSIESSIEMAAKFNALGIPAAHIDGSSKDANRDRTLRDFAAGTIRILTNVDIVSEGLDIPSIEALFMLRPTKSLSRYLQMIGRALRMSEGKDFCYIFDHANNLSEHGLPDDDREWTLEGKKRKKRSESDAPLFRLCPKCKEVSRMSVRICPCGYKLVLEREVDVDEKAELAELDVTMFRQERARTQYEAKSLEDLVNVGRRRGMKHPDLWAKFVIEGRKKKEAAKERARLERTPPPPIQPAPQLSLDPWAF